MSAPTEGRGSPTGTVLRLGAKARTSGERGLPKPELPAARITVDGVVGDYNVYRQTRKAGAAEMALLLLLSETLEALRAEGWPVQPGDLGENVTTAGIPYESLRPPRTVRLGEVVVRTTKPCEPYDNLYLLPYVGAERGPRFVRTLVGRRGWFARVVREGVVRQGDRVELLEDVG